MTFTDIIIQAMTASAQPLKKKNYRRMAVCMPPTELFCSFTLDSLFSVLDEQKSAFL